MDSTRAMMIVGLAATLGCGGPEGSSDFTTCSQSTSCGSRRCTLVEECLVDQCQWELTYQFAGEEYESTCTFGTTVTTTEYPIEGGRGTAEIVNDLQQCFYEYDAQFFDVDESFRCSFIDDCTLQQLDCGPAVDSQPNCTFIVQSPCGV